MIAAPSRCSTAAPSRARPKSRVPISGRVDGNLTVRQRLLIRSTGQISGTVRYGRIEIEEGGEVNGDVRSLGLAKLMPEGQPQPMPVANEEQRELMAQHVGTDA